MKKKHLFISGVKISCLLLVAGWLSIAGLNSCSRKVYPDTVYSIFPETNGQVMYTDSSMSILGRDSLYNRAKNWLLNLDSLWGTHRIKTADPAEGILQAFNRMDIYFELPLITQLGTLPEKGYFNYRITLRVQDRGWKYTIDEIRSFYCQRDQSLERSGAARGRYFEFPVSNRVSRFNREWMTERYLQQLYYGIDNRFRKLIVSLTTTMNTN